MDALILDVLPRGENPFQSQLEKPEESRAGILRYEVTNGIGGENLEKKFGITTKDICVKTHLDPLFTQKDVPTNKKLSDLYKEAYCEIARQLKENYPNLKDIKAVVSESWIFDRLAKEKEPDKELDIESYIYPSGSEDFFRGTAFWGQFVNKDGQINEKRAKKLLETGKPEFKVKSICIPFDEFVEKFGPK